MKKNKARSQILKVTLYVRQVAEARGFTRSKLSRAADVQYSTINRIWNKPDTEITLATLLKIAHALKVPASELYEETWESVENFDGDGAGALYH